MSASDKGEAHRPEKELSDNLAAEESGGACHKEGRWALSRVIVADFRYRWDHVGGKSLGEKITDTVNALGGLGTEGCHKTLAEETLGWTQDDGVSDFIDCCQVMLNLTQLHALAMDLDLRIFAADECNRTIRVKAHQIASGVETRIRGTPHLRCPRETSDESLSGLGRVVDVASRKARRHDRTFTGAIGVAQLDFVGPNIDVLLRQRLSTLKKSLERGDILRGHSPDERGCQDGHVDVHLSYNTRHVADDILSSRDTDASTGEKRRDHLDHGSIEHEGGELQKARLWPDTEGLHLRYGTAAVGTVLNNGALGLAGRAGCEDDIGGAGTWNVWERTSEIGQGRDDILADDDGAGIPVLNHVLVRGHPEGMLNVGQRCMLVREAVQVCAKELFQQLCSCVSVGKDNAGDKDVDEWSYSVQDTVELDISAGCNVAKTDVLECPEAGSEGNVGMPSTDSKAVRRSISIEASMRRVPELFHCNLVILLVIVGQALDGRTELLQDDLIECCTIKETADEHCTEHRVSLDDTLPGSLKSRDINLPLREDGGKCVRGYSQQNIDDFSLEGRVGGLEKR
ncbi:hypothetical protein HG530_011608 [Fusarium avenaceum]|nr:hypothetical protein HG530_011608 [Fusarium avenaceum]